MSDFVVVLCTAPQGGADRIAEELVKEHLAACVSIGSVRSYFHWEGNLSAEAEDLMIIKTRSSVLQQLCKRIRELHSYQVPEIIVLPISGGDESYLSWLGESVG